MNRRHVLAIALGAAVLCAGPLLSGCDRIDTWLHPSRCSLSGRAIHRGMGVRIQLEGRGPSRACCLRCVTAYSEQTGKTVRVLSVTDYVSHARVSPERAFYVVGSHVTPCAGPRADVTANRRELPLRDWDRCLPSIIAFARREDALQFRAEEGGGIESFDEVVAGTKVVAAGEGAHSHS
jgi:nitrous oxide reductase accessory protein NosL